MDEALSPNLKPNKRGDARSIMLARRHAAIDRMLALRAKAISEGMELWDEDRLRGEITIMRGERTSED